MLYFLKILGITILIIFLLAYFINIFLKRLEEQKVKPIIDALTRHFSGIYEVNYIYNSSGSDNLRLYTLSGELFVVLGINIKDNPYRIIESIENTLEKKKENYLKPIHKIIEEITFEEVSVHIEKYFISLYRNGCNCVYKENCSQCDKIVSIIKKVEDMYYFLEKIKPDLECSVILNADELNISDTSSREIVSSKFKSTSTEYLGRDELAYFLNKLLINLINGKF